MVYEQNRTYTRTKGDSGIEVTRHYYNDHTGGHVSYSVATRENDRWAERYDSLDYNTAQKIAQQCYERQTSGKK